MLFMAMAERIFYQNASLAHRIQQEGPLMSDSPTHKEVEEMINRSIKTEGKQAFKSALKEWQSEYNLGPHHFVWIEAQYARAIARETIIRRVVITAVVSGLVLFAWGAAKEWIYKEAISHMSKAEAKREHKDNP